MGVNSNVYTSPRHALVTPSDSVNITPNPRALVVGGAGNVVVLDTEGTPVTYTVQAGQYILVQCTRVNATGTTATNIVALY